MKAKYKMTGCARFAIFLLILAPIAYFGSKYLRESGTWDKIKDKVETSDSNSVEDAISNKPKSGDDILRDIERGTNTSSNDRTSQRADDRRQTEQDRIIEEQRRKIEELERRNQDLSNRRSEPTRTQIPPVTQQRAPTSTSSPGGVPTLDDLLREADDNVGTTPAGRTNNDVGGGKKTLATWSFSFSNTNGAIEFFEQNNRIMSRTTYQGSTRVDISELVRQDDKFVVRNSPTGEYYVLRRDGDLDAYDRSGYQTTCRRQ